MMSQNVHFVTPDIFTVSSVYSVSECAAFIERAESIGFNAASVRTSSGQKMLTHIRNNDRVNFNDDNLALDMWERVHAVLPVLDDRTPLSVDTRLRFYRYHPGQEFKRHKDGSVTDDSGNTSMLSYLIYLNDDFEGGSTTFRNYIGSGAERQKIENVIVPQTGSVLLFRHENWHEGTPVISGSKYVLRSDVFYAAPGR